MNFYSGFIDSRYIERQKQFRALHQKEIDSLKTFQWTGYGIDEWLAKFRICFVEQRI